VRSLPHLITLFRLLCTPLVVWLLLRAHYAAALGTVVLAGVSDWLDGYAARRLKLAGQFGVIFDPLADKVLLVALFVALGLLGMIPLWMLGLAIGRDLVIVVGAGLIRIFRGARKFLPTMLGKVSTFFQIVLVLLALLFAAFPLEALGWLKITAVALSALFTAWSGIDYVRIGIGMARQRAPVPQVDNTAQNMH
jgi:cardiolipin synthase